MSIERAPIGYDLACDRCGESENFDEFMDAVDGKKQLGWRSRKDARGNWEDICPDCLLEEESS